MLVKKWRGRIVTHSTLSKGGKMTNHTYAVYNSCGQFQARFTSYARAVRWAIREGMEWSAVIRREVI
jgi:hypothetical protein